LDSRQNLESREPITVTETILTAGSRYEITEPRTWHSVTPLAECWTGDGQRRSVREKAHARAPTTTARIWIRCRRMNWAAHMAKFKSLLQ